MTSVDKRLRRLEDRAELEDLVHRYFVAADDDDYDGLAACFTDDASFFTGKVPAGATREEVVEGIRQARTAMGLTVHTPDYVLLQFPSEDHATGLVGAHLELSLADQGVFGAVRYHDEYQRRGDAWLIHHRVMRTLHMGPWSEAEQTLLSELPVRWPGAPPAPSERT